MTSTQVDNSVMLTELISHQGQKKTVTAMTVLYAYVRAVTQTNGMSIWRMFNHVEDLTDYFVNFYLFSWIFPSFLFTA